MKRINSSLWFVITDSFCRVHIDAGIRRVYAIYEPYEREDSNEQGTVCLPLLKTNLGLRKILLKFKIIAALFLSFRLSLSSCRAIQRQDMRIC